MARCPPPTGYICTPNRSMPHLLRPIFTAFRAAALLVAVLLVLGLNQRAVSVWRVPVGKARVAAAPRAEVVKQKVLLEATAALAHFVAPLPLAWLPPVAGGRAWLPGLRRALAAPRLRAGVAAAAVFRARLLGRALSPQAP